MWICTKLNYGLRIRKGHFRIRRINNKCINTDFVGGRWDGFSGGSGNGSRSKVVME
jgi:hypothetical protein